MDKPFFLAFAKKEKLTTDCYTFYFERNGNERDFVPGQTYEMKLPHENMDERGDGRVFTISSSPTNKEFIEITTRIIKSTFKMRLKSLQSGESVQFDGPWDDLNFSIYDKKPCVFIAGGIGITPYHSIIKYCIDTKLDIPMILFASWRNTREMIFDDFFIETNNWMDNFSYVPTLTEDDSYVPGDWEGEVGRINEELLRKHLHGVKNFKYYFAGPPAMVKSLKQTVSNMGITRDNLFSEEFEGY